MCKAINWVQPGKAKLPTDGKLIQIIFSSTLLYLSLNFLELNSHLPLNLPLKNYYVLVLILVFLFLFLFFLARFTVKYNTWQRVIKSWKYCLKNYCRMFSYITTTQMKEQNIANTLTTSNPEGNLFLERRPFSKLTPPTFIAIPVFIQGYCISLLRRCNKLPESRWH